MSTYRLWPATDGGPLVSYSGNFIAGLAASATLAAPGAITRSGQASLAAAPVLSAQATLARAAQAGLGAFPVLAAQALATRLAQAHLAASPSVTVTGTSPVRTVAAGAALSANAVLACAVFSQRITITPGNVRPGGSGVRGPLITDPYVQVPGLDDGIYDT